MTLQSPNKECDMSIDKPCYREHNESKIQPKQTPYERIMNVQSSKLFLYLFADVVCEISHLKWIFAYVTC